MIRWILLVLAFAVTVAHAQERRLTQEQIDELAHKHDGYYGALAPQNLAIKRPKPPHDFTGT
jgi:hypothetical protein